VLLKLAEHYIQVLVNQDQDSTM